MRGFHLGPVKLGAMDEAAPSFTIRWAGADPDGDAATMAFYYDTNTNPGDGMTLITSGVSMSAGAYVWNAAAVPVGAYYIYAVANDGIQSYSGYSSAPVSVSGGTSPSNVAISIDTPANNATVSGAFTVAGWAIDRGAATGSGVDAVHVYAYPNPGSGTAPVFLGSASYGGARGDVGSAYGAQFTNSRLRPLGVARGRHLPGGGVRPQHRDGRVLGIHEHHAQRRRRHAGAAHGARRAGARLDRHPAVRDRRMGDRHRVVIGHGRRCDPRLRVSESRVRRRAGVRRRRRLWRRPRRHRRRVRRALPELRLQPGREQSRARLVSARGLRAQHRDRHVQQLGVRGGARLGAGDVARHAARHNTVVARGFAVAGWAIDLGAPSGTGVDAVHVYAFPTNGAPSIFVGVAAYGYARADVGGAYGSRFTNSGFNIGAGNVPAGVYDLVVYAHSSVTGTFNNWRVARVTAVTVQ